MTRIMVAVLTMLLISSSATADDCMDNAKDKNGKPLAGAPRSPAT
jgi:hypothetical protein